MLNLRQLKYFYWVSKLGSYSRAAEQLEVSEPCVYRLVQNLERSCRTKLLVKENRRIRPTRAGRVLQEYAEKIDALEAQAQHSIAELAGSPDGMLAFGVTPPFANTSVDCLASWKQEKSDLRVGLVIDLRNELYVRVLGDELHFAFAPIVALPSGLDHLADSFHDEVLLVAPAGHPLSKRRTVSLPELAQEPFIATFPSTVTYRVLPEMGEEIGARLNISVEVDRAEAIARLIASGAGIGIVSRHIVEEDIRRGRLSVINAPGFPRMIPYGFVIRSGASLSAEANSLIGRLSSAFADAQNG